jgi:hypothetical protein
MCSRRESTESADGRVVKAEVLGDLGLSVHAGAAKLPDPSVPQLPVSDDLWREELVQARARNEALAARNLAVFSRFLNVAAQASGEALRAKKRSPERLPR